jgi:transposase
LTAGVFEGMVHDLRRLLRVTTGKAAEPSAAILDGGASLAGALQSTVESGSRAGWDGHKRKRGSKVHLAVDTLGYLLMLLVTPANEQERAQVAQLTEQIQQVTGQSVQIAFADQGYTGEDAAHAAAEHGIDLVVVKLPEAKRGFVPLPKRWVVERSFAWAARFRRLARDYERLPQTLAGLHFVAFAMLMALRFVHLLTQSA